MANEKILNTRIQLKYDSLENWSKVDKQFKLLPGEIAVAYLAETKDGKTVTPDDGTHPILFKVGSNNGKTFNELPWASALAADVYAWAKKARGESTDIDYVKNTKEVNEDGEEVTSTSIITVQEAIDALQNMIEVNQNDAEATWNNLVNSLKDLIGKEDDAAGSKTIYGAINLAEQKVASISNADASISVSGTATNPTISVALSQDYRNILTLEEDGLKAIAPTVSKYSIVKEAIPESGYAATYHLTKDDENIGASINIPKDMVVESGSVIELAADNDKNLEAGTYIKLVLANATEDELYIPANSLIEYVTSGSESDDIVIINVDDNHKVTATINDKAIPAEKLEEDIQIKLNKAHEHSNLDLLETISFSKLEKWNDAVQDITTNDVASNITGEETLVASGLKAVKDEESKTVNIAIDDSITFIFNCGGASAHID